jgi:phage shock protein E
LENIGNYKLIPVSFLSRLFGSGDEVKHALRADAIVLDVRTAREYDEGRVRPSINISFDRLPSNIERIRAMNKPVVCCSSGDSRSSAAVSMLKRAGIKEVYNGGSWEKVLKVLNS